MSDEPGLSDQYRKSSPWPLLIALGLPLSEVGVVLGLFPIAVGGLVLLIGSIAGILRETEYVGSPWPTFAGLAVTLIVAGLAVYYLAGGGFAVEGGLPTVTGGGIAMRGLAIATAGLLSLVVVAVLQSHARSQPGV